MLLCNAKTMLSAKSLKAKLRNMTTKGRIQVNSYSSSKKNTTTRKFLYSDKINLLKKLVIPGIRINVQDTEEVTLSLTIQTLRYRALYKSSQRGL